MAMEAYITLMGIFIKASGLMIKLMDKVNTHIPMVLNIQGNGKMINNMDLEPSNGQMEKSTKDNTKMERKREKVF